MRQVKVKKIASSISHFCEILLEENKDLHVQVAHLQDELEIYKKHWTDKKESNENG